MTSEQFAGTLPVVPSASLEASDAAQAYLVRRRKPPACSADVSGACSCFGPDALA